MTQPSVLIISSKLDLHARAVAWTLQQHGCFVEYFDTGSYGEPHEWWDFDLQSSDMPLLSPDGPRPLQAVWERRRFQKSEHPRVHPSDREFVKGESRYFDRATLRLLDVTHPNLRWIDRPGFIERAENKLEQLVAARSNGLLVPKTLISRDYDSIIRFIREVGPFVIKPFRGYVWGDNDTPRFEAIANRVDDINLLTRESVSVCPAIYQEAIDKSADIRVVVIGEQIFATRYTVSSTAKPNFDCRVNIRSESSTLAEAVDLDEKTTRNLLGLLRHFCITYASADFAETPDGTLYFLDLNPQGQFIFNEHFVPKYKLIDAMARHITGPGALPTYALPISLESYASSNDYTLFLQEYETMYQRVAFPAGTFTNEQKPSTAS